MASSFIQTITNLETVSDSGFNYRDALFIAAASSLKTASGEPFAGLNNHVIFTNINDARNAVVTGSAVDLFIRSFFVNNQLSRLTIAKLGATYIGQTVPATVGAFYKDTLVNLIDNAATNSLFYTISCDAIFGTEVINLNEYVYASGEVIKKRLVLEQYAPTGITVVDILLAPPPTIDLLSGTKYIVAVGGTGVFSGQGNKIATYTSSGGWTFALPAVGDVFRLQYSTNVIYSGATELYVAGASVRYAPAYVSSVVGFLFEIYATVYDDNSLNISQTVRDGGYSGRVSVVTNHIQGQSLLGGVVAKAISSHLNGDLYQKPLVGVTPFKYKASQVAVLKAAETIWYTDDVVDPIAIDTSEKPLFAILDVRALDYLKDRIISSLVDYRKNGITKLSYDDTGRESIALICRDEIDKARINPEAGFIGALDDPVAKYKALFGTAYVDDGLSGSYYIYVSKITEGTNNSTQEMQVTIGIPLKTGVRKIVLQFNVVKAE